MNDPNNSTGPLTLLGRLDTGFGLGAAEIVAFDPGSQRLFVVNSVQATVDIVDLSDPGKPRQLSSMDVTPFGAVANSVDVAGGLVAVAVEAAEKQAPGTIAFFDLDGANLGQAQVGSLPDMVTFTPDGKTLLVANEGEPSDDYQTDPEGSVSVIDLTNGVAGAMVHSITFSDFNQGGTRSSELPDAVRIFGPNASVAQDLEPEYITVSADGTTAWVALQENNALAVIDLTENHLVRIDSLGFKDHSQPGKGFDASNQDGGIHIRPWPVLGMYQPDSIASFHRQGVTYILTANEGDSRNYRGFSEEKRVGDLSLDADTFANPSELQKGQELGRLKTTTTLGDADGDGQYEAIYSFGTRSFSIWNGEDGSLVFDSGDDFEQVTAVQAAETFNSSGKADSFDSRSDDKGPEPEAVVVGNVAGRTLAFVGLERTGGVMVYDVTVPAEAFLVGYQPSAPEDQGPEGLEFISGADSPNGKPLLIAAHEVSGTVVVYEVAVGVGTGSL